MQAKILNHLELQLLVKELFIRPAEVGRKVANEVLRQLKHYYYETSNPAIPDEEYDRLEKSLKLVWPDLSMLNEIGSKVSGPRVKQKEIKLPFFLGSLNKVYSEDISWFNNRKEFIISEKLNGSSIYAEFENRQLTFASTRGTGEVGYDITHKAKIFCKSIKLNTSAKICVRGEMILIGDSYKKYGYKNRLGGVVGISKNEIDRGTEDIIPKFYELIDSPWELKTERERWQKLEELGFPTPRWVHVRLNGGSQLFSFPNTTIETNITRLILDMENYIHNHKKIASYDMDGLVIADNSCQREDVRYPKNKIAFKCNEEGELTTCKGCTLNVSRTGKVVPIVNVEPIQIQGIEVKNASGFNAEYIEKNGIQAGVQLRIIRGGDIIPYIKEIIHNGPIPKVILPNTCPCCGEFLTRKGVDLWCLNEECSDQNEKRIEYFLRSLGVEEMSIPTIKKLNIKSIQDIYNLDSEKAKLIPGLGERSVEKIVEQINKTLSATAIQLFTAFGISNCAVKTCEAILEFYEFDQIFSLKKEDLTKISGVGETIAQNIVDEIPAWKSIYEFLLSKGLSFKKEVKGTKLAGVSFCFTGALNNMKRQDAESLVKKLGGKIQGVNKTLTYLVTNTPDSGSSKNKLARDNGVKVITEEEFLKLLK